MATQHQPDDVLGFVSKTRATSGSSGKSNESVATPANYTSIAALDARLTTLGYTATQLQTMTRNDKIFALRLKDDAGTL